MRNLKLTLSYDGSEFSGWQVQPDASDRAGDTSLSYWTHHRRKSIAARVGSNRRRGARPRTGGHVRHGVPSVPTANFVKALNDILPAAIRVLEVTEAAGGFPRPPLRAGENLPLSHFARLDLPAIFGPDMSGTFPILWMNTRWRRRRGWWWGSMISLRSRRSIRSGAVGAKRFRREMRRSCGRKCRWNLVSRLILIVLKRYASNSACVTWLVCLVCSL